MNKLVTIFRYLALVGVATETFAASGNTNGMEGWLISFLLYAVNFQLRYFNYTYKKALFFSLLFDLIFIGLYYNRFQFLVLFAAAIFIFDSLQLKQKRLSLFLMTLFVLLLLVYSTLSGVHFGTSNVIYMALIGLLSYVLAEYLQQQQYLSEENLKLQQRQNELEKNKEVMEQYMGSMRELYTLKERNRLSRELHDSVGHSLSTIIIQLGAITNLAKKDAPAVAKMSESLREFSSRSMKQVREQLAELKPDQFSRNQVFTAIDEMISDYQRNTGIQVNFGISEQNWLLSEKQELLLYRTMQEFLSNSAKYAEASRINIFLHFNESQLILTMKDNGRGAEKVTPHLGLSSIDERIKEARGELKIITAPGSGFQMQVRLSQEKGNVYETN